MVGCPRLTYTIFTLHLLQEEALEMIKDFRERIVNGQVEFATLAAQVRPSIARREEHGGAWVELSASVAMTAMQMELQGVLLLFESYMI